MKSSLKDNLKRNNGITLIALVITIIVLLILAGVSITMLTGDNGIIIKAQNAKIQTEKANERELVDLAVLNSKMNDKNDFSIDKQKLGDELSEIDGLTGLPADTNYEASITFPLTVTGKTGTEYVIDEDGNIKEIEEIEEPTKLVQPGEIAKATVKNNYKDDNDETATIPRGFEVSETDNTIDTGLVVIAPDKSEFVWIPVDENLRVAGVEEKEIAAEVDGNYKEKLYSFSKTQSKCFAVKRTRIM